MGKRVEARSVLSWLVVVLLGMGLTANAQQGQEKSEAGTNRVESSEPVEDSKAGSGVAVSADSVVADEDSAESVESRELGRGEVDSAAPDDPGDLAHPVPSDEPPSPEELEALTTPGDHHDHLAAGIGSWLVTMKVWDQHESPPMELSGTSESRWILGGRFVETKFEADFMGQKIEGLGIDGYDNQVEAYQGTWRDTLGTSTLLFEGNCESNGKIRTMVADFVDPVTGIAMRNKGVLTVLDADSYRYESFLIEVHSGREFKNLELLARRK